VIAAIAKKADDAAGETVTTLARITDGDGRNLVFGSADDLQAAGEGLANLKAAEKLDGTLDGVVDHDIFGLDPANGNLVVNPCN